MVLVLTGCPSGNTQPATNVTTTEATLNAKGSPNGTPTEYWFQYGTTTAYGSQTPVRDAGSGTTVQTYSERVSGLTPGKIYHYRVVARQGSSTYYGSDQLFATQCGASVGTLRYPDLKTLSPFDLRFDTATIGGATHHVLRFSNTVWDAGEGPLELHGVDDPSINKTKVYQRVFDGAGGCTQYAAGDYVWHPEHSHFHFEGFADYQLWTRTDYDAWLLSGRKLGQAQRRGTKTTACVWDSYRVQALPGSPSAKFYDRCTTDVQGISVGWGDAYYYTLPEQWIDLGTSPLPDGRYVLRSVADPGNRLYESQAKGDAARESEQANEGVTFFSVSGGRITLE